MNPIYPILLLAAVAVIASLLSARYQRKEKERQEAEFMAEFEETWTWPPRKEEL